MAAHVDTMLTSDCVDKHCKYATEVMGPNGKTQKVHCDYKEKDYFFGQCISLCEHFAKTNPNDVKEMKKQENRSDGE